MLRTQSDDRLNETKREAPREPVYVLKFGSSVLRSLDDLPAVAGEIYRQRRAGRQVVAVVSALAGETDRLFAEAEAASGTAKCAGWPELIGLGEERTAALLRIACDRIGLSAAVWGPEKLGLRTEGDTLNAQPVALDAAAVRAELERTGLIIVPGFVGVGADGARTLLGRGGSDYSAVFIGGALSAECVRLYKDVDGVFDRDPALGAGARRYSHVSWADAVRVARQLIQPKAVDYAALKRIPIEVEAIGSCRPTRVAGYTLPPEPDAEQRPVRVALAGYGVVGQALAERLSRDPRFELGSILVRDCRKARATLPPRPLTSDVDAFVAEEPDVLVDLLSCEATSARLAQALLPRGVELVSASKRLIAGRFAELQSAAEEGGARFLYSAAAGGSAPVLETLARARAHAPIASVTAILNGTVNFILSRLAEGLPFAEALAEARAAGFAEENCDADLSGADAAAKLRLVAHRAFDTSPEALDVFAEPLDEGALRRIGGTRWVQVARLSGTEASVRLLPAEQVPELAAVTDEWNVARVETLDGRTFTAIGRGAGGAATTEAVVADLYDLITEPRPQRRTAAAREELLCA